MSRERSTWLVVGLIVLVALGLLSQMVEKVEIELPVAATGQAAANDWYGVERLLEGLGVPTTSAPSARELPPTDQVVLLFARGQTSAQATALMDWVASGGHLIAALEPRFVADALSDEELSFEPGDDPIIGALGLLRAAKNDATADPQPVIPPQGGLALLVSRPDVLLTMAGWTPCIWPEPSKDDPSPCSAAGHQRLGWGKGWVTLIPSAEFLDNEHLGEHDHARFLWSLMQREGPPPGALLVFRDQPRSLWSLIAAHASAILIAAGALLILWLWAALPRFGPLIAEPPPGRRSLVEHVVATGELLWRHQHQGLLLKSARRQVLRRTLGTEPDPGPVGMALLEAVAAETGLSTDEIRPALSGLDIHDREIFTGTITALERLRRVRKTTSSPKGTA